MIKQRDWIQMTGCIIEAISDCDGPDCHGEVVLITDDSMARELGIYVGLTDYWEVIGKEPYSYEEKRAIKLDKD
jgi:hypothetical protein